MWKVYFANFTFILAIFYLILPETYLFSQKNPYLGKKVSSIEFYGIHNTNPSELYDVISSRYNEPLKEFHFTSDVQALFSTGYFSNVIMRVRLLPDDTVGLSYEVVENPEITEIDYVGLVSLNSQDFIRKIPMREGDALSLLKAKEAVRILKASCIEQGLFQAEVWYRLSEVDPKYNTVKISFIIDEGENIPVGKINIIGLQRLNPDRVISILKQKEGADVLDAPFDESKFEEDKQRIMGYAKSQGLLDVEIDEELTGYEIRWFNPKKPEKGRVVVITYKLIEGKIIYFGGNSVEHIPERLNQELNPPERVKPKKEQLQPLYDPKVLLSLLEFSNDYIGDIFDETRYFRDRASMQDAYARQGYVYAQILPQPINFTLDKASLDRYEECKKLGKAKNAKEKLCKWEAEKLDLKKLRERLEANPKLATLPMRHIHYTISENNLAYVENIIIRGNEKTKEYVIHREILIKEGQLFNSSLVTLSRQRLLNLQYFSEVNLQMRPGSNSSKMNIVFDVKEQPTGNIQLGGTYGVQSGFLLNMKLGENNLNGTGQRVEGSLNYGPNERSLGANWSEPWFYESCEKDTAPFWKEKQKAFNESSNLSSILVLSNTLQNTNAKLDKEIHAYAEKISKGKDTVSIEQLDKIKQYIRVLLASKVWEEERCYRSVPLPWSLNMGISLATHNFTADALNVGPVVEAAEYQINVLGLSIGTSHALGNYWSHYHSYSPQWSAVTDPSALSLDSYFIQERQGTQFQSSIRNGLVYSNLDNSFTTTSGQRNRFEVEVVGSFLGGDDHFNRYSISGSYYWWWFDLSFGGFFINKKLRKWRIVQEFTMSATFTQETRPVYNKQDKETNPFFNVNDRLLLGGPGQRRLGRLRGYSTNSSIYPPDWRLGGHHMILWGSEFRIPIEPRFLWLAFFLDAGSLYNSWSDIIGEQKLRREEYANRIPSECPAGSSEGRLYYNSCADWRDPNRTELSTKNIALDRFLYSWGYGFRVQLPVLPLRIFYAQKLYYDGGLKLKPIPHNDSFDIVFAIGDYRF